VGPPKVIIKVGLRSLNYSSATTATSVNRREAFCTAVTGDVSNVTSHEVSNKYEDVESDSNNGQM